jgi:hypothetical protein
MDATGRLFGCGFVRFLTGFFERDHFAEGKIEGIGKGPAGEGNGRGIQVNDIAVEIRSDDRLGELLRDCLQPGKPQGETLPRDAALDDGLQTNGELGIAEGLPQKSGRPGAASAFDDGFFGIAGDKNGGDPVLLAQGLGEGDAVLIVIELDIEED